MRSILAQIQRIIILYIFIDTSNSAEFVSTTNELKRNEDDVQSPLLITKQLECTNTKYWSCSVSRIAPFSNKLNQIHNDANDIAEPFRTITSNNESELLASTKRGNVYDVHVFYLNKVDPVSGKLFVSATLRWRYKASVSSHSKLRFYVTVLLKDSAEELGKFQVDLDVLDKILSYKTNPVLLIRFDNSDKLNSHFYSNISSHSNRYTDKLLTFGNTYIFKIDEVNDNENATVPIEKMVSFSTLFDSNDVSGCALSSAELAANSVSTSSENLADVFRRKELASRWSTSIREITFYPLHLLLNVSFYGAPPSHCIRGYSVELWFHDVIVHDKKFVPAEELVRVRNDEFNSSSLVGSVTFGGLQRETKYTIRVVPQDHNTKDECVCEFRGKCGCVTIRSNLFTLNNLYEKCGILDDFNDSVIQTNPAPAVSVQITDDDDRSALYWIISAVFLALTLIFLGLLLLLFIFRTSSRQERKRNLFLVYDQRKSSATNNNINNSLKPLIGEQTRLNVLILSAETDRQAEANWMAQLLRQASNNRVNVIYDRWEVDKIEENLQRWVHNAVSKANKIILFHGKRAASLIGNECLEIERNIFDDVFHAAHASMIYTDPRIIHAKWNSNDKTLFRYAEHVFLFPRDLKHMFLALGVHTPGISNLHCLEGKLEELIAAYSGENDVSFTNIQNDAENFKRKVSPFPLLNAVEIMEDSGPRDPQTISSPLFSTTTTTTSAPSSTSASSSMSSNDSDMIMSNNNDYEESGKSFLLATASSNDGEKKDNILRNYTEDDDNVKETSESSETVLERKGRDQIIIAHSIQKASNSDKSSPADSGVFSSASNENSARSILPIRKNELYDKIHGLREKRTVDKLVEGGDIITRFDSGVVS